ncbi:hypothetical protein CBM2621_B140028 [Cupriavidus taiwanensis]|nr:hypothetical protein CBM2621_B140028 [Cupriavidus taiwanensis]
MSVRFVRCHNEHQMLVIHHTGGMRYRCVPVLFFQATFFEIVVRNANDKVRKRIENSPTQQVPLHFLIYPTSNLYLSD